MARKQAPCSAGSGRNGPQGHSPAEEPRTKHFRLSEMAAPRYKMRNGRYVRNKDGYAIRDRSQPERLPPRKFWPAIQRLFDALEVIREAYGKSLGITGAGGWRDQHTNRARRKVSQHSWHLKGKASDLKGSRALYEVIKRLRAEGKIPAGGLSLYRGFVHYDIRGTNRGW